MSATTRRLCSTLVFATLTLAGCQSSNLQPAPQAHPLIPVERSPLSFVHPDGVPLKARFRRPGTPGDRLQTITGFWRPSAPASYPVIQMTLQSAAPGKYFTDGSGNVVDSYLAKVRFGDLGKAVPGEKSTHQNAFGPVNVQRFKLKDVNCFAFAQIWTTTVSRQPNDRLLGYYCHGTGLPPADGFIDKIVQSIGVAGLVRS